jgi:hypothetical protein
MLENIVSLRISPAGSSLSAGVTDSLLVGSLSSFTNVSLCKLSLSLVARAFRASFLASFSAFLRAYHEEKDDGKPMER